MLEIVRQNYNRLEEALFKVGVSAVCYGPHSTGDFIRRSAQAAERAGFSSFWFGEHTVLFASYPESPYPYSDVATWDSSDTPPTEDKPKGEPPVPDPRSAMWEPVTAMTWAAAATRTIEVGTSILILPQRNPVVLAKELSALDEYSQGRVTLGAGIGWCKEEMDALGMDWRSRGKRMDEYIAAMRALWQGDASTFEGATVSFKGAYMYPKPVRKTGIPIMVGGDTDIAIKRVARLGDGWLAFFLPVEKARARIDQLKSLTREQGRDPEALRISCAIFSWTNPDDLKIYRDAGVTEFLLFKSGELSLDDAVLNEQLAEAAQKFVHARD
jgi:probable F420-dependent oxidoreductase